MPNPPLPPCVKVFQQDQECQRISFGISLSELTRTSYSVQIISPNVLEFSFAIESRLSSAQNIRVSFDFCILFSVELKQAPERLCNSRSTTRK